MIGLNDIPSINATLNAICAVLLVLGFAAVRARRVLLHRLAMSAAFALSTVFLCLYVTYHVSVPQAHYGGESPPRPVFLALLASHVLLAVAVVPLVLTAVTFAVRGQFDRHRRIARVALPIWLYVCITGVTVYLLMRPYYPR